MGRNRHKCESTFWESICENWHREQSNGHLMSQGLYFFDMLQLCQRVTTLKGYNWRIITFRHGYQKLKSHKPTKWCKRRVATLQHGWRVATIRKDMTEGSQLFDMVEESQLLKRTRQKNLGVQLGRVGPGWRPTQAQPAEKKFGFGLGPTRIQTRWTQPELNLGSGCPDSGSVWSCSGRVQVGPRPKNVIFIKFCEKMSKFNQNLS